MRKLMATIALAFVLVKSGETRACTCLPSGTVLEELDESAAVFSGRVVSVREDLATYRRWARVRVLERFKGVPSSYVIVETPLTSAACGISLEEREEYLFYAYARTGARVSVNLCSRTAPLDVAGGDLVILRRNRR